MKARRFAHFCVPCSLIRLSIWQVSQTVELAVATSQEFTAAPSPNRASRCEVLSECTSGEKPFLASLIARTPNISLVLARLIRLALGGALLLPVPVFLSISVPGVSFAADFHSAASCFVICSVRSCSRSAVSDTQRSKWNLNQLRLHVQRPIHRQSADCASRLFSRGTEGPRLLQIQLHNGGAPPADHLRLCICISAFLIRTLHDGCCAHS